MNGVSLDDKIDENVFNAINMILSNSLIGQGDLGEMAQSAGETFYNLATHSKKVVSGSNGITFA
jgi:hypothetical protein